MAVAALTRKLSISPPSSLPDEGREAEQPLLPGLDDARLGYRPPRLLEAADSSNKECIGQGELFASEYLSLLQIEPLIHHIYRRSRSLGASVSLGELKAALGTVIERGTSRGVAPRIESSDEIATIPLATVHHLLDLEFCALMRRSEETLQLAEWLRERGFILVRDVVGQFESDFEALKMSAAKRRMLKESLAMHGLSLGAAVRKRR